MLIAKKVGFSVSEMKYFDVGDIIGVAGVYFGGADEPESEYVRKATQDDFDNF